MYKANRGQASSRPRPSDPIEAADTAKAKPLEFWYCGDDPEPPLRSREAKEAVEREVYRAVRELLSQPFNLNFLIEWVYPSSESDELAPVPDGWGVHLEVDGRRYKSISADIDFDALLDWEMESHRIYREGEAPYGPPTGPPLLSARDEMAYGALARRMRRSAERLEAWLGEASGFLEQIRPFVSHSDPQAR